MNLPELLSFVLVTLAAVHHLSQIPRWSKTRENKENK